MIIRRDQPGDAGTLRDGLTDSPVGHLAWIVVKFKEWTDSAEGLGDAVDRDQLLTKMTLYWLTATAGSSARFYKEDPTLSRMAGSSSRSREGIIDVVRPDQLSEVPIGEALPPMR